jgi:hypothetical protein
MHIDIDRDLQKLNSVGQHCSRSRCTTDTAHRIFLANHRSERFSHLADKLPPIRPIAKPSWATEPTQEK